MVAYRIRLEVKLESMMCFINAADDDVQPLEKVLSNIDVLKHVPTFNLSTLPSILSSALKSAIGQVLEALARKSIGNQPSIIITVTSCLHCQNTHITSLPELINSTIPSQFQLPEGP